MMNGSRRPLGIALLVLAIVAAGGAAADEGGFRAPDFRARNLAGKTVELSELLGRGPIVVDFWATWCKPCIKELPYIQRLHEEYAERGVTVLAVTIDSPKSQSRVRPFVKGRRFTFPVLLDGDQRVFQQLQGKGSVPYVVVIDRDGFVRYRHTGYRPGDEKALERVVQELLEAETGEDAPAEEAAAPAADEGEASAG
jgi:peroxiredoxin